MWPYSEALAQIQAISEGLSRLLPGYLLAQHHLKGPPSSPAVKGLQLCLSDPVPNSRTHEAPGRNSNLSLAPTQGLPADSWLLVLSPQRVGTDKPTLLEKPHPSVPFALGTWWSSVPTSLVVRLNVSLQRPRRYRAQPILIWCLVTSTLLHEI